MNAPTTPRHPRWLRVVPGVVLIVTSVLVLLRTWDAVTTGNIVLPVVLMCALLAGAWLIVSGLRSREPARRGDVRANLRVLAAAFAVGIGVMIVWLTPLTAEPVALDALASTAEVTVTDTREATTYEPTATPDAGLVLYPGARVDPRAYAVLARDIASQGYRVVVPKCPLNIALMCIDAADDYITDDIPWAVGGHSLGGVAASDFAAGADDVDGLVFWASYPLADLAGRGDLDVASISGTQDGLSTQQDIAERKDLLPTGTRYVPIRGGIHSFFGDYGLQPGDGVPTTTRSAAQRQIVAATVALLETISKGDPGSA